MMEATESCCLNRMSMLCLILDCASRARACLDAAFCFLSASLFILLFFSVDCIDLSFPKLASAMDLGIIIVGSTLDLMEHF